ncbi:TRAP transporter permease, partial [Pseudomonas fluorescens]|nr:TRAP transporter permease [Pseudomonas fluorescens]
GKLFIAGIIPGILAMTMYMMTIFLIGYFRPDFLPKGKVLPWRERFAGLKDIWAPVLLFVFVIGGLYGLPFLPRFTPTEAGGVGAAGAFIIGVLTRPARPREDPGLAAPGNAHRGRGVHRADRRADLRLFPHGDADAAEGHRVPHRPRPRPLRRAGA